MEADELTDDDLDFAIDASQEWQCRWWSHAFRVSPQEVREAVRAVGSSANAVREHLLLAAAAERQGASPAVSLPL
ncbi:MAG TPA: DUF3606 domain-containing protein [Burkholderiales bacterium]|nr:DUF3606 domain-containing protein [Burkholderiales bacterium]